LAFDGRVHHLEKGYWLKFEIGSVEPTPERPHGLRYAFTLHDPELVGFDNAHGVAPRGSRFRQSPRCGGFWTSVALAMPWWKPVAGNERTEP